MSDLTNEARNAISDLSIRYGLPESAVEAMARAVANGGGTMAQFNIPELGGSGQWMAGGMTMVGDMFNHGLKMTVDNLCGELSNAMANQVFFNQPQTLAGSAWWPDDLGQPASVGGQNQTRYAYFPLACRIAFDPGNGQEVIVLDTLDHQIGGWSQQQSAPGDPFCGISFSSQYGQFALSSLPRLGGAQIMQMQPVQAAPMEAPAPMPFQDEFVPQSAPIQPQASSGADAQRILETIGQLAALHDAGVLTDAEFSQKKAELLARL